ncbi:DUF4242 domain-containing protein [Larkinella terrae]|uniref:DUF4242 domain-containing protein n=1 Tax=Larkinella terrae TaxID=2025311 RepID=A0A7K0EK68_9BACT|nr:DUF4242 domain-containing protein [Larkinella terrae]MRS62219.1 DUF4242 domain-containing protein [Larkinella terrae]
MKTVNLLLIALSLVSFSCQKSANEVDSSPKKYLFLDVHNLEPGKVTFEAVMEAHKKDLATQGKYDVNFIKFWVDEAAGKVYCLSESPDSASVYKTHRDAHGLVPAKVQPVSTGHESAMGANSTLFLDIHELGPGNVTAKAVAEAHAKDLAVQGKYNVNFINYWVDEETGTVICLSEAKDANSVINTHKEAHGLIPAEVHPVKQGQ